MRTGRGAAKMMRNMALGIAFALAVTGFCGEAGASSLRIAQPTQTVQPEQGNKAAQKVQPRGGVRTAVQPTLQGVRFGSGAENERIVFDLTSLPQYTVQTENDGQRIVLLLTGAVNRAAQPSISGDMVDSVNIASVPQGLKITIELEAPASYKVNTLANPPRLFVDVQKEYERIEEEQRAPGLKLLTLKRLDQRGRLTGWVVEADPAMYRAVPVLAKGAIAGRASVSAMSDAANAAAAINASYFAPSGEIIGLLKIEGTIVGTTYFRRSAVGFMADGRTFFGPVDYMGRVTLGRVSQPVGGVDAERGADSLVLYNKYYSRTTRTNEYGLEYVVQNGRVSAISPSNTLIPENGVVVSVHGKVKDAFSGVKVGDSARIEENIGSPWGEIPTIVGAGPTLVKNGEVHVTAEEEQFPPDIAQGRAPRTAFGVTKDGHYLLAVVDGRQAHSIGCTLREMAEFMLQFGAVEAINFDGGGSSELVVGGRIENSPSDGAERPVGSALALVGR